MSDVYRLPVSKDNPPVVMHYNKEEEFWEAEVPQLKRVIAWLEPDEEDHRCYINVFSEDFKGKRRAGYWGFVYAFSIGTLGIPFMSFHDRESKRSYFDMEAFDKNNWDYNTFLTFPVLMWSPSDAWAPLLIPDNKTLSDPANVSLISRERKEELLSDILEQLVAQKERKQEETERIDEEWDEWERKQEEQE